MYLYDHILPLYLFYEASMIEIEYKASILRSIFYEVYTLLYIYYRHIDTSMYVEYD